MKSPLPFFVALALLGGCFSLPTGLPPDLSTPEKTLAFLRDSYLNLNYGGVDYVLNDKYGGFLFVFDPDEYQEDVGGFKIPFDWGKTYEMIATQNMFAEAERIEFDEFDLSVLDPVPEGVTHYSSQWIHYRFRYYDVEGDSYYVNGYAQFELEKQGEDWIITRWMDQKAGENSWGWLKFLYRYL